MKKIIILVVVFAAFFRFFELNMPDVIEDEDGHIRDALAYYNKDPFSNPRHHPFHHTPGNMGHPFFHHFLISFSYQAFGVSYAASRLPAAVMSLIAALSVYYLSREMFDKKTGLFAGSLYLLSPLVFRISRTANVDNTYAAIGGLSLYYFYKYLKERKLIDACWVGLFAAVFFSTRLIGIVIFAIFAIYLVVLTIIKSAKFTKKDILALFLCFSVFTVLFFILNDPYSYLDGIIHPADPSSGTFTANPLSFDWPRLKGTFISLFPWHFSILLLVASLFSLINIYKKGKYFKEQLLLIISMAIFFYGFRFSLERGLIIFLVPACILAGKLLSDFVDFKKTSHLAFYLLFSLLFIPDMIFYGFRTKPLPMPPYDFVTHYYTNRLTMFKYLNSLTKQQITVSVLPSTLLFPQMNLRKDIELIPVAFRDPKTTDYFLTDNKEIYESKLIDYNYELIKYSEYKNDMAALFKRID